MRSAVLAIAAGLAAAHTRSTFDASEFLLVGPSAKEVRGDGGREAARVRWGWASAELFGLIRGDLRGVKTLRCAAMVHPQLNRLNPDYAAFNDSPTGIYRAGQGIMACEFAFGHDEYAYLWALHNKVAIPREGLAILRLHSCYVRCARAKQKALAARRP
jgi:hypothetical protein